MGRIVHDERGVAQLEWHELPASRAHLFERITLEVESTPSVADAPRRESQGFNPYARAGQAGVREPPAKPKRRDLRKLSEWIKLRRGLEERRRRQGGK